MNRTEAIALLQSLLPFGDNGEEFQCNLDGNRLENMLELVDALTGYGYVSVNGIDKETGEECLVFVDITKGGTEYIVVTPTDLNYKVMQALYAIVD